MLNSAPDGAFRFCCGRCMAGTLRPADLLTVAPASLADVRLGDVVIYRVLGQGGEVRELVHRIVAVAPGGWVAQGDNSDHPDSTLVTADNLVGRVAHAGRDGRRWPVRGGRRGLLRARLLRVRRHAERWIRRIGGRPYRCLRNSGMVPRLWRPAVDKVRLTSRDGPLVKYLCAGRTVACWWPEEGRFECRKPYDLVISRPGS